MRELDPAPFFPRAVATIVDTFMILFPITIVLIVVFGYNELKTNTPALAGVLQMSLYGAVVIWLWVKKGYTPGKKVMRLIVLDNESKKTLYLPQAIFRFLCYFVSMISVVGLLLPLIRKDKKTLHDILSNTIVVRI